MTSSKSPTIHPDAEKMISALESGDEDRVMALLAGGFAPDAVITRLQQTVLMVAAWNGMPVVVQALLDAGARVDTADALGDTALHNGVRMDEAAPPCHQCMALLIGAGCLVDARGHEDLTALERAIIEAPSAVETYNQTMNYTPAIQALLDGGADPALLGDRALELLRTMGASFIDQDLAHELLSRADQHRLDIGTTKPSHPPEKMPRF